MSKRDRAATLGVNVLCSRLSRAVDSILVMGVFR